MQGAVAAGSLLGPLIGALLISFLGFRPLLLLMGFLTGICALIASFLLTEQQHTSQTFSTSASIIETYRFLFLTPRTRVFIVAGICVKLGSFGLVTAFAPYIRGIVDSPTNATTWVGILQSATWGATFLGSPWWGKRNDLNSVERNFIWASLIFGLSILLQSITNSVEWIFLLRVIQGFSFSALLQSVFFVVLRTAHQENHGVSIGATNSSLVLGQIIGSLAGAALAGYLRFEYVFFVMGLIPIVGAFMVWSSQCSSKPGQHRGQGNAGK